MLQLDSFTIRNIYIVRQHNQLGDMLCAIPSYRALKTRFPLARLTLIASPVNYEVMEDCPLLDKVLNYDKVVLSRSPFMFFSFLHQIRNPKPDIAIVMSTVSSSFTSNALAWITGAQIRVGPFKINGKKNASTFFFTHPLPLDWSATPQRHQIDRNLDTVRFLGADTTDYSFDIGLREADLTQARKFLEKEKNGRKKIVGIHPGAGKPPNRWDAIKFAQLAERLYASSNVHIVITAGPMDDEPVQIMRTHLNCPYTILRGYSIKEIAAFIDSFDLYVTNDTGTMHVAAATRTHILSLFGSTNPHEWAPWNSGHKYLQGKNGNIEEITLDEVEATALGILKISKE